MPNPHGVGPTITQGQNDGLSVNLAYDGSNKVEYVGYASPGSAGTDAAWQIQKLTYDTGNLATVRFAGKAQFNQAWDSRASLTYA